MVRSNLLKFGVTAIVFIAPLITASRSVAVDLDSPSSWLLSKPIIPELPDDDGGNHSNNDDHDYRHHRHDWDDRDWDNRDWDNRRVQEYCDDLDSRRERQECRDDWEDRRRDHDDNFNIFEEIFGN